jgi:dTDP-4-dehydrorhamnose reductase
MPISMRTNLVLDSTPKNYVIGASGVIGTTLFEMLTLAGLPTIGTRNCNSVKSDLIQYDLRRNDTAAFVKNISPNDTVFLLAAYSNPSWIYEHKDEATALNREGTLRFIDCLRGVQPHLIFMSSVEVFDGTEGFYSEGAKPNPLNFYGRLKHEVENHLRASYPRSTVVRTGWNVGMQASSRCVVRLTYESLLKSDARMANDNVFSIVDASDTAAGLIRLIGADDVPEIHFAADLPLIRTELAELVKAFSVRGAEMSFKHCQFSDIRYSEPRGRLNNLDNSFAKMRFKLTFRSAIDVVRQKVQILDQL